MAKPSPAAEQKKWAIVAGLGVVLAVVVGMQFATGTAEPLAETPAAAPAPEAPAAAAAAGAQKSWPAYKLADLLKKNPFARLRRPELEHEPPATPPGEVEEPVEAPSGLAALQTARVKAIFLAKTGAAALIDDKLVKVGDVLEGMRVVAIDPDGVTLEPVENP